MLEGRFKAKVEDILAAGYALCTTKPEYELWKKIAEKHIEEHKRNDKAQMQNSQGIAIKALVDQLERDVMNAPTDRPTKDVSHTLRVLSEQLSSITPNDPDVQEGYDKAKERFAQALSKLHERALGDAGLNGKS